MSWTCPRCHADYVAPRERCEADGWKLVENMVGRTIGERYFIEKLIGIGGMRSTIWRALQRPTDRPVAVKILPAASVEEAQRFERGARIASNLNHPHITTVHDYGTADGAFYLVMEMLEGHTLQHMLRQGNLGLLDTMVMVDQMLRALEHAHAMNVVHRDLKPSNLFVTKKNDDIYFVKILDFGLAKLATTGTESSSDEDDVVAMEPLEETPHTIATGMVELNDITQAQRICGTPEYMAPEQILGAPLDRRTDLYALGVVLYRMVVGQLPFRSRVRHELYQQHLSSPPPPFPATSNVPEPLQRIIMKALAKRPADRFADASEMRIALRAANRSMAPELGGSFSGLFPSDASSTKPRSVALGASIMAPVPAPSPRRRVWPLVALALLGGGGIATAIILSSTSGDSSTTARNDVPVEVQGLAAPSAARPAEPAPTKPVDPVPAPAPMPAASVAVVPPPAPEVVDEVTVIAGHGTVAFATKPAGAEVLRDGKVLGTTPLQLVLPSGEHTLELRASGYAPSVMPVTVVAGQQVKLDIELQVAGEGQLAAPENSPAITGARRRPVGGREVKEEAPPTPIPTTSVLGRDVSAPPPAPVKVLGRDVTQEKTDVKILGSQVPSPEPKVKVLGQ